MSVNPDYIQTCLLDPGWAEKVATTLLDLPERPDGIFAFNDRLAHEAMKVAKTRGLRIPEDLALVGFGDMPLSSIVEPELSTVVQPAYQMGKLAAELMLLELETDEEAREYQTVVLPTSLLPRASSLRQAI